MKWYGTNSDAGGLRHLREPKWVQVVAMRPGNPSAVHPQQPNFKHVSFDVKERRARHIACGVVSSAPESPNLRVRLDSINHHLRESAQRLTSTVDLDGAPIQGAPPHLNTRSR